MAKITQEQAENAVLNYLSDINISNRINSTTYNEESQSYTVRIFTSDGSTYYDAVIPENIDNISAVVGYVGPNDNSDSIDCLSSVTEANNNLQTITVMTNGNYDGFHSLEMATSISENLGCDVGKAMQISYSAGDYNIPYRLDEYSKNHPDMQIYYLDNEGINYAQWHSGSTANMVANGNVTIIYNGITTTRDDDIMARKFEQLGLKVYQIEPQYDPINKNHYQIHTYLNRVTFTDGYVDYLLGLTPEHGTSCTYKFYDIVDGKYVELTEEELYGKLVTSDLPMDLSLEDKRALANGQTGTLVSDLCAISVSMNELNSCICNYNFNTLPQYTSTTSIPANINDCENGFLSVSNGVLSNLNKETELIRNAAQCIYDMDNDLANKAYSLSDGSSLFGGVSSASQLANYLQNYSMSTDLKITNFMFSPGTHTQGNTGAINKNELIELISSNSSIRQNLSNEISNSREMKTYIQNFSDIKNQGRIVGEVWNVISEKLNKYDILMDKRIEYATALDDTIVSAVQSIIDYMGDYDSLDDTKLEQERENERNLVRLIATANSIINATKVIEVYTTDKKGRTSFAGYQTVYVYSEAVRSATKALLEGYQQDLAETRKLIGVLENLWQVIAKAEQSINDVLAKMYSDYATEANNTIVGTASTYEPLPNTNFTYIEPPKKEYQDLDSRTPWYKVSEEQFEKRADLKNKYDSYDDYLNKVSNKVNDAYIVNKVSEEEFNDNSDLKKEYDNYIDYLSSDANTDDSNKKIYLDGTEQVESQGNNTTAQNSTTEVEQQANLTEENETNTIARDENYGVTGSERESTTRPAQISQKDVNTSELASDYYSNPDRGHADKVNETDTNVNTSELASDYYSNPDRGHADKVNETDTNVNTTELASDYYSNPDRGHADRVIEDKSINDETSIPNESESASNSAINNVSIDKTSSTPVVPTDEKPTASETPIVPTDEKPTASETPIVPTDEKPTVNKTPVDVIKKPATNNISNNSVIKEPVIETPIIEEPIIETPIIEEPIIETPIVEEPIIETPIVEEPIIETPIVEKPVTETPIIENPLTKNTSTDASDTISKIAIAAGVATTLGGAAYGAYKYNKSKKYEYDYDYEKDEEEDKN